VIISNNATGSGGLVFQNSKRTAASATNTGFANARLYRPNFKDISETYILSNPPFDFNELWQVVDNYFKNIKLPKENEYRVERWFYKETWSTPRDYVETSYKYDCFAHHKDDLLLYAQWAKTKYGKFIFYIFYDNNKIVYSIDVKIDKDGKRTEIQETTLSKTKRKEYKDGVEKIVEETTYDILTITTDGRKKHTTKVEKSTY
jgi:hypothetical protein